MEEEMKRPIYKNGFWGLTAILLVLCLHGPAASGEGGVTQKYKAAATPFDQARVQAVIDLPKDTVQVKGRYQGGAFWTQTRKDKIPRFKCSQCHNNETVQVADAARIAHGNIVLDHGGAEKPLACFTCHSKDQRNLLVTESGESVDLDHSYQLCGQCHFRQKKDWTGGAHGKRVGYWAGHRVVKPCTACHDPHSPLFKKRWPKTYSSPTAK